MWLQLCDHVLEKLQHFNGSNDIEVQERANSACMLIEMLRKQLTQSAEDASTGSIPPMAIEIVQEMALLFAGELIPVAPKAQRKVPLPDGLDLDEWINAPPPDDASSTSSEHDKDDLFVSAAHDGNDVTGGGGDGNGSHSGGKRRKSLELTPEQLERQRMARLIEQSNNPHYLKSTPNSASAAIGNSSNNSNADQYDNIDDIPITELPLDIEGVAALRVGSK